MKNKYYKIIISIACILMLFSACTSKTAVTSADSTSINTSKTSAEHVEVPKSDDALSSEKHILEPTEKKTERIKTELTDKHVKDADEKSEKQENETNKKSSSYVQGEENIPKRPKNQTSTITEKTDDAKISTPIPSSTLTPMPEPESSVSAGYRKSLGASYGKDILRAINKIKAEQGYAIAFWSSELATAAQKWSDTLIDESIAKNDYKLYHDTNRDSSESIIWISKGTSAASAANEIASHSPKCISNATEIGIGATVWMDCPIGDNLGFVIVRYYS